LYLFVLEPRGVANDSMLNTEFSGTDLLEGCQSRSHLEAPLILQITLARERSFRGESRCRAVPGITYIPWLDNFGTTTIKRNISADSKAINTLYPILLQLILRLRLIADYQTSSKCNLIFKA